MAKKYFWLICFFVFLSTSTTVFARDVILASGHPEYPPIMFKNGNEITGVAVDIAREVFRRLGYDLYSQPMGTWENVQQAAKDGQIDVIFAIYKNAERERYLNYSIPIMMDPVAVFVRKDKPFKYSGLKDLIGKKGTTSQGESWGGDFDQFKPKLTLEIEKNIAVNIQKLVSGQSDYFIFGLYPGLYNLDAMKLTKKIEQLPLYVDMPDAYIAIAKSSKYAFLITNVNAVLQQMKSDGTILKIFNKYNVPMISPTF